MYSIQIEKYETNDKVLPDGSLNRNYNVLSLLVFLFY